MPSLTDAIESKYNSDNFVHNGSEDGSFVIFTPKSISLKDEGCAPSLLVLNKCEIDTAGDLVKLQNICVKVEELDLSHNQLVTWDEIFKIMVHIPALKFMNLSYNNLRQNLAIEKSLLSSLHPAWNLETLVLIGTEINWNSVWSLLNKLRCLKEFHLSLNKFCDVSCPSNTDKQQFDTIEKLMFDGNRISGWFEISKLGQIFPSLKHLSVSNCPLRLEVLNSEVDDRHGVEKTFQNLEVLNISSTLVQTEDEIMRLNKFTKLKELRISGIPFLNNVEAKLKRQELIALLPKIQVLNGGATVTLEERDGAERYFIRKFLNVEDKPSRYCELVQKHGQLEPLVDIKLRPVTKITLKILFGQMEINQEVNLRQSVSELKKFLEPIVGLPPSRMDLYFHDVGLGPGRDILRFPDKQLYTYNMHDGDEIQVEIKNNCSRQIPQH